MSLGDAYIEVHSDGTHFEAELLTQVRQAIRAAESIAKVTARINTESVQSARTATRDAASDLPTVSARDAVVSVRANMDLFEEELLAGVRDGIAAADAIAHVTVTASSPYISVHGGSASVHISPDFTDFETKLLEGVRLAVAEANKIAKVDVKATVENIRGVAAAPTVAPAATAGPLNVKEQAAADRAAASASRAAAAADRARTAALNAESAALRKQATADRVAAQAAAATARATAAATKAAQAQQATVNRFSNSATAGNLNAHADEFEKAAAKAKQASTDVAAERELDFNATTAVAKRAFTEQAAASKEADAAIAESKRILSRTTTLLNQINLDDARKSAAEQTAIARQAASEQGAVSDAAAKAKLAQVSADGAVKASARETAQVAADAYQRAYEKIAAAAELSGGVQRAEFTRAAAAAKAAAAEQIAAQRAGGASTSSKLADSILGSIKKIPTNAFGALITSAKFATIGVVGLGTALAGIGLVAASKQQAALVSFQALAGAIVNTKGALADTTAATNALSDAQKSAISNGFLEQLINIANNSAISQTALQDTSQALLALNFNGGETIGTIRAIGNALAASGKTGGGLNDDLKGVVVALSQISGAGRLLAQDLNQITTRIPSVSRTKVYKQIAADLTEANKAAGKAAVSVGDVRKLLKAGGVGSDVAIPALIKVLQEVPGAAGDAAKGLDDALGRQNTTLAGRFEGLKDTIRNALAKAFLPLGGALKDSPIQKLADQLKGLIDVIPGIVAKVAGPLQNFVTSITGTLIKVLPGLAALIGKAFSLISKGFAAINTNLDAAVVKFKAFGALLSRVGIGPALGEAFKAIGAAIPPIIAATAGILVGLTPVLSIVSGIARVVVAVLAPAFEGAAIAIGAMGVALAPVAALVRTVADAMVKLFGNKIISDALKVVGAIGGVYVALAALRVAALSAKVELIALRASMIKVATAANQILIPALELVVAALQQVIFFLAANPIVAGTLAIIALGVAFYELWQNSELFRKVVVDIGKALILFPLAPLLIGLKALSFVFEAIAGNKTIISVLEFVGKVITGIVLAVGVLSGVIPVIVGVIVAVREVVKHFGDIVSTVKDAAGLTKAVFGVIAGAIATAFGKVVGFFKLVGEGIGGFIATVAKQVGSIVSSIVGFFVPVVGFFKLAFEGIGGFIGAVADKLGFLATAFDAIKGAASTAGDFLGSMFNGFISAIDFVAGKIRALFEALSKAAGFGGKLNPFHGLANDFDKAAHAMDGVTAAAIGATNKIGAVALGLHNVDGTSVTATIKIQTIIGPTSVDAGGFTLTNPGDHPSNLTDADRAKLAQDKAAADAAQQQQDLVDNLKKSLAGIGGGSTGGGGAGSAATKAASALADKITAAKSTITDALKAFATDVTTETPKQIRSALNSIRKQFDKLAKLEGLPHVKLDKLIELDSTKLQNFAKQIAIVTAAVEAEKSAITSAFSAGQAFTDITTVASDLDEAAKSVAGSAADLSHLRIIKPGQDALNVLGKTVAGIQSGLDAVTASIQSKTAQLAGFAANAQKALKAGLNPETEAALLAGGPTESNLKLAQELAAATPAQIAALNAAQKAADSASAAVAKIAGAVAGPAITIGNQIVDGLIAGLKDEKKLNQLKKSMQVLANTLVDALRKALKIKSPSRRMGEAVGAHIVPGIIGHIDHAPLRKAMGDVADTLAAHAPKMQPIDLSTLGGLAQAEARLRLDAALAPANVQLLAPKGQDAAWTPQAVARHLALLEAAGAPQAPAGRVYEPTPAVHAVTTVGDVSNRLIDRAIRGIR